MKKPRAIHRAAFRINVLNQRELTLCGKTSQNIEKTSEPEKVTCTKCKLLMVS